MRVRLFFFENDNSNEELNIFKKIIFPIQLNEVTYVKQLKERIQKFLNVQGVNNQVENLFLDNFLLMDQFEIALVLNNDDEIKYLKL